MTASVDSNSPHSNTAHPKHNLTGFIIFLCSESVIFLAFFSGFALLKTSALNWLPAGVEGLEWLLPSPPPEDNFGEHVPTVIARPYGYGTGKPLVEHQEEIERELTLQEANP